MKYCMLGSLKGAVHALSYLVFAQQLHEAQTIFTSTLLINKLKYGVVKSLAQDRTASK